MIAKEALAQRVAAAVPARGERHKEKERQRVMTFCEEENSVFTAPPGVGGSPHR